MNYFLVLFTSRTETLDFANILNKNFVRANVVSAPSGLGSSCNIAISVLNSDYSKTISVLNGKRYFTLVGLFKPQNIFGKTVRFVKLKM